MNWCKSKLETLQHVVEKQSKNDKCVLYISPRPYVSENEEPYDVEVLSVQIDNIPSTTQLKELIINSINEYDKCSDINTFFFNDEPSWLDKNTRIGLINSLSIQKDKGLETSTIWINGSPHVVDIERFIDFLRDLEIYAIECYNTTQTHIQNINMITDRNMLFNYNFCSSYPEKLHFAA